MKRYVILDKAVGQTPLQCAEAWRAKNPQYKHVPLAYAGRLDPMASGKLLVLIGEECKRQTDYHDLDKRYEFAVLLGVKSDSGDVLGLVAGSQPSSVERRTLQHIAAKLTGSISLPYPHFSAKTVRGKPLHVWTLEGRLDEITIPTYTAKIYQLECQQISTKTGAEVSAEAATKIETIPPVTEASKALGNDFRRPDVRRSWQNFYKNFATTEFQIAHFSCTASSGTYMRTLAEVIAKECSTTGLAYSITRTHIGRYQPLPFGLGFWRRSF